MLIKRSLSISGHRTSLALEAEFCSALILAASEEDKSLAALVAEIDKARDSRQEKSGLASAIRVWLFRRYSSKVVSPKVTSGPKDAQWCEKCGAPTETCDEPHD
ncbi:MAG: ribbon-helix-helix domain-containing protein [Robiginitomaculum sp.]|nr:ribbon-helix-helix domain-containing protein [Robiginitomaculum sp.]